MIDSKNTDIYFVDTTLRDGQESLWATGLRMDMILPIASRLDDAGFDAVEVIATTNFKKQIRDLKENPWERIQRIAERIRKTPLRAVRNRYMAAFQITPTAISDLFLERLAAHGVGEIRLSDPSNTARYWKETMVAAARAGLRTVINLIYSISPKHTDEYYARRTRQAAQLKPYRICLKDPSGLLTPERVRTLMPLVLQNSEGITAELHPHCNTGLGPLVALEAVRQGVQCLNTALPPLANGSSNPSLFNITKNLRALGYRPILDEAALALVSEHLESIARRNEFAIGAPLEYSEFHVTHQVPGGMISNFRHQLGMAGMEQRLPEVLEEIGRVRAELGYPIMVTPYSQFVGVQATLNVILGERYKEVADEIIQYALGFWGEEECAAISADVKDKILDRPRARELAGWRPPQPSTKQLKERLGGSRISDDDLLLIYFSSQQEVAAMKTMAPYKRPLSVRHLLVELLAALTKQRGPTQVHIQTGEASLRLEQRGPRRALKQ
jgi:oxaloacetate decarboxylase alpha subunit